MRGGQGDGTAGWARLLSPEAVAVGSMDSCHRGPQGPLLRDSETGRVPGRGPKGTGKSSLLLLSRENTEGRGRVSVSRLDSEADLVLQAQVRASVPHVDRSRYPSALVGRSLNDNMFGEGSETSRQEGGGAGVFPPVHLGSVIAVLCDSVESPPLSEP